MSMQQEVLQQSRKRRGSGKRLLIFVVCSLFVIGSVIATALQFLSPAAGAILAALPILVALATWLFPLPPLTDTSSETSPLPQPIQLSFTVQVPSALSSEADQQTNQQTSQKTIWNVPYRRNLYFTGREDVLQLLHERLCATKTALLTQSQAISGLGGIGKTQIAVEYAYRHREEYSGVLWVNAATRDTIIASFLELAALLTLPQQIEADQNKVIVAVQRWFGEHNSWLLIFDNADDLTLAEEFLPISETGFLLLTTCSQAQGTLAETLTLGTMTQDEGTLLLLRRAKLLAPNASLPQAKVEDRTQAEHIVDVMGCLPLALDQAAAYIEETGCTLVAFLEHYQRQFAAILGRRGGTGREHPLPVATTWSLALIQVKQTNQAAADLLHVCSFLAPDAIPEELLKEGARELGPLIATWQNDSTQMDEAIGILNRFSLVRRNREEQTLSLHRLIQAVQLLDMDEATRKLWAERAVRAVHHVFPKINVTTWHQCERLLPHAVRCHDLIESYTFVFPDAAVLLNELAVYLEQRGQYPETEPLYQRALAIREQALGPDHPDTARSLINLAGFYNGQGKYKQAELLYQRALAVMEKVPGPDHPDTAQGLNNLAVLYDNQGKYEQAELLHQRALTIREQALGLNHPDTTDSLNNLAVLYDNQGKYEQAEPLYQRALTSKEQTFGPDHPETAIVLNNLAVLYDNQGKYEQAELLHQRALTIREQALGPNHPDTAQSLNNLAGNYFSQGKYNQAEPFLKRALAISEEVLGPNHPATAQSLNNLAVFYDNQDKYEQAELLLQRALTIKEQILGPNHPDTAQMLNNVAIVYMRQGKDKQAEPLLQRALAICEQMFGPNHSTTKTVRASYDMLLVSMRPKKKDR